MLVSFDLSAPILKQWVPCSCFPLINNYFYKKLSLYIQIPFIWDCNLNLGRKVLGIQPSCVRSPWFSEWALLESSFLGKIIHWAFYCESSLWEESQSSCFSLCVSLGKELRKYSHLAANGLFIHELTSFSAKHFLRNVFLANKSAIELFYLVPTTTEMFQISAFVICNKVVIHGWRNINTN